MGLSSSKKKTTNDPAAWAKQPILDSLADTRATYQANQPQLQQFANDQRATYGRLAPGAEQGITSAQGLVNANLRGDNLAGNPYLDGILKNTRQDITNDVTSQFSGAGRYGSGMFTDVLTRRLADAENNLRFQNYSQERGYQQDAIGQAQNLMGGATGLLNNAAELPWVGVRAQNGGVSGLSNGYGTQTTKSSGSVLDGITQAVGIASKAASLFSDERLKEDKKKIGTLPDGLDVFQFTYKGDPTDTPQTGLMAQQVEKKYPEAVETDPASGFKKVDYSAVPDAESIAPAMQPVNPGLFGTKKIKPSFNGPGGLGEKLGEFGDYLLAFSGNPLGEFGMRQRLAKQQAEQEEAQYQRHRNDKFADWQQQYEYELAHPKPFNNDTIADYNFRVQTLGRQAADEWLRSQGDPIVTIPLPGDRIYSGPRSGLGAALGGALTAPMPQAGAIVDDPRKGGAGSTQRPFDAVIQQESGGRAGAIGPQTRYGRAQGLSQMLPATAEEQARKLGIAWRPDLMTGTTPEAAAYQRQLGEAYFNEGIQRTGNLRDALRYYHGGPNRGMWGRKTNAYADAVMARIGG